MRKYLFLIIPAFMLFSCGNVQNAEADADGTDTTATEQTAEYQTINATDFDSLAGNFVDQEVMVEGTCVHTCKNNNKKMHIVGDNLDARVVVMATDESGKFNADMEGTKYHVVGKVLETRIDSAYLAKWEEELLAGEPEAGDGVKHKHGEEADNADAAMELEMKLEHIDNIRKEIAESEKGYLSNYTLECVSFEEVK